MSDERHVDLVGHDWCSLSGDFLIERIAMDDPRAANAGKVGDYADYSVPHSMAACPYEDDAVAAGDAAVAAAIPLDDVPAFGVQLRFAWRVLRSLWRRR